VLPTAKANPQYENVDDALSLARSITVSCK